MTPNPDKDPSIEQYTFRLSQADPATAKKTANTIFSNPNINITDSTNSPYGISGSSNGDSVASRCGHFVEEVCKCHIA